MSEGGGLRWSSELGPATVATVIQLVVLMIGGVYMYAKLDATASNTADTTKTLQHIVDKQEQRTNGISDRLIKVETQTQAIADTLTKVDTKVDRLQLAIKSTSP